jgi:hypothetical protein
MKTLWNWYNPTTIANDRELLRFIGLWFINYCILGAVLIAGIKAVTK